MRASRPGLSALQAAPPGAASPTGFGPAAGCLRRAGPGVQQGKGADAAVVSRTARPTAPAPLARQKQATSGIKLAVLRAPLKLAAASQRGPAGTSSCAVRACMAAEAGQLLGIHPDAHGQQQGAQPCRAPGGRGWPPSGVRRWRRPGHGRHGRRAPLRGSVQTSSSRSAGKRACPAFAPSAFAAAPLPALACPPAARPLPSSRLGWSS